MVRKNKVRINKGENIRGKKEKKIKKDGEGEKRRFEEESIEG